MSEEFEKSRAAETEIFAKPQSYQELIAQMTPSLHQRLKTAVELGKWENGDKLAPMQLEHCIQAIIAYDQNLPETERVAYIDRAKLKKTPSSDGEAS